MRRNFETFVITALATGCTVDDRPDEQGSTFGADSAASASAEDGSGTGVSGSGMGDDTADGETDAGGDDTAGDDGPKLDIPDDGDAGGSAEEGTEDGCQAVDFLFVIDNSESMEDDQVRLINAFPEFIDGIQNTIQAQDYHIGVITTDDHVYDYDVYYDGGQPTECDVMGGLVTENWDYGTNSHRVCGPFAGGQNFLTSDEPDLTSAFECIAFVDDEGSTDEAPMAAIAAALESPPLACNDGFLRDDALLVIVLITDEDDDNDGNPGSGGTPQQWYESVVAAKAGGVDHVLVLALAGTPDCPYEHTVRIEEWVGLFGDRGFMGSVCVDNYGEFFTDSVTLVDDACDQFVPVG